MVEAARKAGALGAKLSGGGRGGNMIALVKADEAEFVAKALDDLTPNPFPKGQGEYKENMVANTSSFPKREEESKENTVADTTTSSFPKRKGEHKKNTIITTVNA